jgi:hypothetical protein
MKNQAAMMPAEKIIALCSRDDPSEDRAGNKL